MSTLLLKGAFIASKQGKTGLTVTVDLYRIALADATSSKVVTDGSASEVGGGIYVYRYASADCATYEYVSVFKTSDSSVDQQHVHGQHFVMPDELVGSRLATTGYTAPLDAAGTRAAVGLGSANLDTQLAGLPTDADVQAAATAALNAYDPPTKAEMDAGFAGVSTSGAGSETVTLTSTDNSSVPLEGVAVWVTSDSAGAAVVAGTLYSNTLGVTTFYLDPGTYYAWRQGGGVNWTNPQTITVVDA